MKGIPQILQLPVIVNRRGSLSAEIQSLQKRDFLFGDIAAQRPVLQELYEPWFNGDGLWGLSFGKLKSLEVRCREPAVWGDCHAEGFEIDIPGVDDRIEE